MLTVFARPSGKALAFRQFHTPPGYGECVPSEEDGIVLIVGFIVAGAGAEMNLHVMFGSIS